MSNWLQERVEVSLSKGKWHFILFSTLRFIVMALLLGIILELFTSDQDITKTVLKYSVIFPPVGFVSAWLNWSSHETKQVKK